MHDHPSAAELVAAVRTFLAETARPALTGHAAFHARVAENALAIVERELAQRGTNDAEEAKRLKDLLNVEDEVSLAALNAQLSRAIRDGQIDETTLGLLDHLKATAIAQVSVDQPRYSGLKTATKPSDG